MYIKTKILIPTIVLTLFVTAAVLLSNIVLFSSFVDETTVDRVNAASKVAVNQLNTLKTEARAVALSMAENEELKQSIVNKDQKQLLTQAQLLLNKIGVDFCTITDEKGTVLLRTHLSEKFGDSIAAQSNIREAMAGTNLTTIEGGTYIRLSVRSGAPIFDDQGTVVGTISTGFRLDTDLFVDSIKEQLGCEVTICFGDERISTTVRQEDGIRAVGTRADPEISETVLAGNSYSGQVDILGRAALCRYTPILNASDQAVGMIFIGRYVDDISRITQTFVKNGLMITLPILTAFIVILLFIIGRIVQPIHAMTEAATALETGDTDIFVQVNTKDEMRTLADAFNSMIENTRQQIETIERIAQGDTSICVKMRSEKDVMNAALANLHKTIQAQASAIREEHERIKLMLDATPLASRLWSRDLKLIECNEAAVKLFGLKDKQEYLDRYFELTPKYQPNGQTTHERIRMAVTEAFEKGEATYEWMYQLLDGTPVPSESILVRVPYGDDYVVAAYSRDLREHKKMLAGIEQRDHLLQTVNRAADLLLRSETDDFFDTLQQCMGMMTRSISADRMYLHKDHFEDGKRYNTKLLEWSENIHLHQDISKAAYFLCDEKLPQINEKLCRGECVHCLVCDLPPVCRECLGVQNALSVMIVPVFLQNEFWGFVGFDNSHSERLFTENEESIMRSGSLLIANAFLRNESILKIRDTSAKLEIALADAKEANNAKSSFLAHMSHEIRTPLNAVIGLSELILGEGNLNQELETNLEKIYGAGSTILSIVNDILDISKIESGKFELYPCQYDTPSLVNDTVTLNIVRIGEKPITFKLNVDEKLPVSLYGDDLRVKQIFNNLLSNAFKYTNTGTVEWQTTFERDGNDIWLVSSIRDSGIGIKPEDVQRLFSDYNQVDTNTNRRVEGTGLGLAITKRLVEMMGGTISVESIYGKGSTFQVRLPQVLVSDTPIGKEVAENLMGLRYTLSKRNRNTKLIRTDLSYARILVVDDIEINLDVVKGMMKPYGVKIDCATSGMQAIEMIRAENPRYCAVFMDHMMPGMDGIEATRIIREEIGTDYARDIPVIALTANAILGNEEMFLSRGFQDFISKPIDMMKLDAVLRRWVRDKNLEQEQILTDEESYLSHENISEVDNEIPLLANTTINGMDKDKCLECLGNNKKVFVDVLRSYAVNTPPLISRLDEYLAAENWEDYAVVIHGIKGASYGIFAQEVGKAAEILEIASKAENIETVKTGHHEFKNIAEELLRNINNALREIDAVTNKPIASEPSLALLQELREACRAFDMDRADKAMTQLESFQYESGGKIVEWLREHMNNMTFEEIYNGEWPSE